MDLVLIADDFGISTRRNDGIIALAHARRISAASLLVNGLAVEHAVAAAQACALPLGLHLNLSEGEVLSGSLRKHTGRFFLGREAMLKMFEKSPQTFAVAVADEFEAQYARFVDCVGYVPRYYDGHQHLHLHPRVVQVIARRAKQLGVLRTRCPMEYPTIFSKEAHCSTDHQTRYRCILDWADQAATTFGREGISYCERFYGLFCTQVGFSASALTDYLKHCAEASVTRCEIMCHPGYADLCWDVFNASYDREQELEFFLSAEFSKLIEGYTIVRESIPNSTVQQKVNTEPPLRAEEHPHATPIPSEALVKEVLGQEFNDWNPSYRYLSESSGIDNHLYCYEQGNTQKLLRFSMAANALAVHSKEVHCAVRASAAGLPTMTYARHCTFAPWSILVRDYRPGETAAQVLARTVGSEREKWCSHFWECIGMAARQCHSIRQCGFGVTSLLQDRGGVHCTLTEWVEVERTRLQKNTQLVAQGLLSEEEYDKVVDAIDAIAYWQVEPVLCHGDLSLSNIVQTEDGEWYVIDWGNAIAHCAPHFDVAEIAVWNPPEEWLEPFAKGYQTSVAQLSEVLDESIGLQLWRVCTALQRDIERMPQRWREAPYAAQSMTRLTKLIQKIS